MPKRIQLRRSQGWRKPADAVVVSRPSKWGNPFTVATVREIEDTGYWGFLLPRNREQSVICYERWLHDSNDGQAIAEAARAELKGKDLCCWCPLDRPWVVGTKLQISSN